MRGAADFVIRHSAVMLLIYVALIGSAGWLLVTTPQGFIPAQDRGYVIVSAQLPGAASLARTTEVVRQIEKIALDTPGIVRVAAFAGFSGATRTQAGNAAALFPVFEEPEVRLKKGLSAAAITGELRKRLSAIQGAFIIVIPPPPVPGIGTGGGFTMRIQDRQGRGPELLAAANDELVGAARKAPGLTSGVLALHREHAAAVRRYRPRQGAETRRADRRTSTKRSRPISARPTSTTSTCSAAPITSPRRPICRSARRPSDLARLRTRNAAGDMVKLGSVVDFRERFGAGPRRALQPLSGGGAAGRYAAGNQFDHRHQHHEAARGGNAAERILL